MLGSLSIPLDLACFVQYSALEFLPSRASAQPALDNYPTVLSANLGAISIEQHNVAADISVPYADLHRPDSQVPCATDAGSRSRVVADKFVIARFYGRYSVTP